MIDAPKKKKINNEKNKKNIKIMAKIVQRQIKVKLLKTKNKVTNLKLTRGKK